MEVAGAAGEVDGNGGFRACFRADFSRAGDLEVCGEAQAGAEGSPSEEVTSMKSIAGFVEHREGPMC